MNVSLGSDYIHEHIQIYDSNLEKIGLLSVDEVEEVVGYYTQLKGIGTISDHSKKISSRKTGDIESFKTQFSQAQNNASKCLEHNLNEHSTLEKMIGTIVS